MYIIHNIYILHIILYYIYNILLYNILLYNIHDITIYIHVYWGLKQQFGLKCFARAQEWSHKANGNHIGFYQFNRGKASIVAFHHNNKHLGSSETTPQIPRVGSSRVMFPTFKPPSS
jgi:hypothetical protein